MNRRFKLFKKAVETKDQNTWADYNTLRNEITSDLRKAKSFYPRLHMRYQFGGVVQIKMNLILWNLYIVGLLELYITSRATCPLRM